MINDLNDILNMLEDAIDTENWELVRQAKSKLEILYERLEITEEWGDNYEE
jgi:uncharacterized coiled-coil protein SlyX